MNFDEIWTTHQPHLKSFIKTKVKDLTVVEDILQDVSLKLYQNLSNDKSISDYKKWLFQVTRNTIADYYRKQTRVENSENLSLSNSAMDYSACPCDIVEFVIKNYLPKKYADPLLLSDIKDLPQKEIAEQLNLGLENTKSRIQRGRKQLRKMIEECVEIEYDVMGKPINGKLKSSCQLPDELLAEIEKFKIEI